MGDPDREVFRHSDLSEGPFFKVLELAMQTFRFWGVAVFFLIVGVLPAGLLLYLLAAPLTAIFGTWPSDWLIGFWFSLSVPIALYCAWRRWQQIHHNYLAVDSAGLEYFWFPRSPRRIPWSEVVRVRDTFNPDEADPDNDLIVETTSGKLKITSEFWPKDAIQSAMARHVRIQKWGSDSN